MKVNINKKSVCFGYNKIVEMAINVLFYILMIKIKYHNVDFLLKVGSVKKAHSVLITMILHLKTKTQTIGIKTIMHRIQNF